MKKAERLQEKINALMTEIEEIQEELQEKFNAIEEKQFDRDSGEPTEKEQEKMDLIDSQMNNFAECYDNLESAMNCLNDMD